MPDLVGAHDSDLIVTEHFHHLAKLVCRLRHADVEHEVVHVLVLEVDVKELPQPFEIRLVDDQGFV